jgi:adenine-specific DNA-methyltransferase
MALHQPFTFPDGEAVHVQTDSPLHVLLPQTALIDAFRQLLPRIQNEVANQLQTDGSVPHVLEHRTLITGVPDQLFDGSPLWNQEQGLKQIIHETAFAYLLQQVFWEALRQNYGLGRDPVLLERCIPELAAYTWFVPSPALQAQVEALLTSCLLSPLPLNLAGTIYQSSLSREEKKTFGQYYTPLPLVNHLLDQTGYLPGRQLHKKRLLDIATGFGVFLAQAAARLMSELQQHGADQETIFHLLERNLFGYDLHPFPVIATKFHILVTALETLHLDALGVQQALSTFRLPGVRVADTLAQPFLEEGTPPPDIVVGNPPYGQCRQGKHLQRFVEILDGRANLYQLFLYFALQRATPGGSIALLVPESLRSGRYFRKLRHHLATQATLRATTDFQARAAIFPDVEQGVLILVCQKNTAAARPHHLPLVRVAQAIGEESLAEIVPFQVKRAQVQLGAEMDYMLCKARTPEEFALLHRVFQLRSAPSRIRLGVHTGRFVWNQHRQALRRSRCPQFLPILYAQSIHRYAFDFSRPYSSQYQHLLYAESTPKILQYAKQGSLLLLQRTTAPEQRRRLIATLLPSPFAQEYPQYLIENHVNFIDGATVQQEEIPLEYVLGLLNSKLVNFLFAALSGTTQVSAWELQHLPLLFSQHAPLHQYVIARLTAQEVEAEELERQIDAFVYQLYELSPSERELVDNFHAARYSRAGQRML